MMPSPNRSDMPVKPARSMNSTLIGRTARVSGRFRSFNVGEASEVGFE